MLTGERYLNSKRKRAFDVLVAHSARPAESLARWVALRHFALPDQSLTVQEERSGQNQKLIVIEKVRTRHEDGQVINEMAERFRKLGLDEAPQLQLVREGKLSIFGRRPLLEEEEREIFSRAQKMDGGRTLVDIYRRVVIPAKPGLISTFGFQYHIDPNMRVVDRLRTDITDHLNAGVFYDLGVAAHGLSRMLAYEVDRRQQPLALSLDEC